MAFKSKINPEDLSSKTYKDYFAQLKKEIQKAEKFGETDIVILSDFKFACDTISTMMILGKFSGPLAKWYKKIKIERKQEKDFAKGTCYFKQEETGETTLNIALQDGKGRPNKMQKNGKNLFKRLGFSPNIFKGEFLEAEDELLSNDELAAMEEDADEMNDDKKLALLSKRYQAAFKTVANQVIPAIQNKLELSPKYLEVAKIAYITALSFIERFDELSEEEQSRFAEFKQKVEANLENLKRVVAKVKQLLMSKSNISGNVEEVLQQLNAKKIIINQRLGQLDSGLRTFLNL